ncbi:MAG: hypothetical protein K2X29_05920, partial [Candidatus Obscuribacterales bacterium]|nr:hypothetical protein [Candidatus Obscuribacterales bacterium]
MHAPENLALQLKLDFRAGVLDWGFVTNYKRDKLVSPKSRSVTNSISPLRVTLFVNYRNKLLGC